MNTHPLICSLLFIIVVGQINDLHANQINLKQSYCRDLRDCQTYFPCAVFSSGFSYLFVIKRCPTGQIFDEKKQKCVKNTSEEPGCAKQVSKDKPRTSRLKPIKRKNETHRQQQQLKLPSRPSAVKLFKRKNFEQERTEPDEQIETTLATTQFDEPGQEHWQRVCYVTNWSRYRAGEAKFEIEYIDPFMCSHIVYAYATVDDNKPEIIPVQKEDIEHYRELAQLKKANPALKISIRLGGKSALYTRYLKKPKQTGQLVRSLIWYLATYGFDGVDIAFEFPDHEVPEDRLAVTTFLEEISKQKRLMSSALITLTVPPFVEHLPKVYDVEKIEKLVDYFHLMTFDFYGPWDERTGVFAPLYHPSYQAESEALRNVDGLVKLWLSLGVAREKIIIGLAAYGRSFTLASGQTGLHAPVSGPGYPGRYTKTRGFLSYYEICEKDRMKNWQKVWLESEKAWYMTSGDQWITYENVDSAVMKAQYAKAEQLAGLFVWSIDNDEFSGFFCNTDPFPITREVFAALKRPLPSSDPPAMLTASPPVRLLNVKSQQPSHLPADLQKLLKALSVLSSGQTHAASVDRAPPPPVAHQTYNAEFICGRHHASRNGIYRDRTNCSIFYFCEGDDLNSLRYHIFFCPPGLEFSMDTCTCDWPTGRSCQRSSDTFCLTQTTTSTTTTTTTTTPVYMPEFDMNSLNSLGQLLGITGGATSSFDCTGKQSGLYRDMHECTKFYFCTTNGAASDGALLRYDFACPARYAFSMDTCRCELDQHSPCRTLSKTDCLLL